MKYKSRYLYAERVTAIYGGPTSTGEWTPAVDLYETRSAFYLVAEVAGVNQRDVNVEVEGNTVTLKGKRFFERKGVSLENYYRISLPYGTFERIFHLPCNVDESGVEARLHDGVLTVKLPRHSSCRGRSIPVAGE